MGECCVSNKINNGTINTQTNNNYRGSSEKKNNIQSKFKKDNYNNRNCNINNSSRRSCIYCNEPYGKNFCVKNCDDIGNFFIKLFSNDNLKCAKCNYNIYDENIYYCSICKLGFHLECIDKKESL